MTPGSPKSYSGILALPKSISSIVVSVGGLALFLILASWLLISNPGDLSSSSSSTTVNENLFRSNNIDHSRKSESSIPSNTKNDSLIVLPQDSPSSSSSSDSNKSLKNVTGGSDEEIVQSTFQSLSNDSVTVVQVGGEKDLSSNIKEGKSVDSPSPQSLFNDSDNVETKEMGTETGEKDVQTQENDDKISDSLPSPPPPLKNSGKIDSGECDLYHGKWFYDSSGPLYTNNTCPVLTQMQNCQGNGRPDKDYENWRWKPSQCDLPRFDGKKFLELMKGKTLAFIGDSVARNQMESMLCLLWQVEVPKNRGNRHMQRWFFRSTNVMIVRIWSSWLVRRTSQPIDFAPEGVVKLHLDAPDDDFMSYLPQFDVVVLSSGHWFAKQSVYMLNNEVVGGQLYWPDKTRRMKVNNIEAFGISTETILTSISTYLNYTGLTIVRSFSPDHYEGGAWNTGGSCTGKVKPADEVVENGFTNIMHEKQLMGFKSAVQKSKNGSKLRFMDITEAFGYRHDGHPGPYRNPDPNKKTKRGPNGEPPPQDCLHWCMPGPVDTWNELVLEIIRREFEGSETSPTQE